MVEFEHFKMQAGLLSFVLSTSEWIEKTNAIGIYLKQGKYGGTYAHKDIAFEFGSAISAVFRLFLIKEFQRLKDEEIHNKSLEWNLQRTLSKINYRIHTNTICLKHDFNKIYMISRIRLVEKIMIINLILKIKVQDKYGKHKRLAYSSATLSKRTACATQRRRHYANEIADEQSKLNETTDVIL